MNGEQQLSKLNFAPGETNVKEAEFSASVILFWLKVRVGVSSVRIMIAHPNTVVGLIPLGSDEATFSLNNVASVGVNVKASVRKLVGGFLCLIISLAVFGKVPLVGVLFLLLAISLLANTVTAALTVVNNGGGSKAFSVSILQKAKLEQFREEINQRLFADHALLRHNEHMSVQNQQLSVQQQQLNAQIMQQNAALQQQAQAQDPR
jgi:hypothetical protein